VTKGWSYRQGEDCQQVLDFLVKKWPRSLLVRAHDGAVPLSVAVRHGLSFQVIRFLVEKQRRSVQVKDSSERLPLHVACEQEWSADRAEIVRYLVEQFPHATYDATDEGHMPLHSLMRAEIFNWDRTVMESVRIIARRAPLSARIASKEGAYPLHYAAQSGKPVEAVRRLVQQWPESCHLGNKEGSTALHLAVCRMKSSTNVSNRPNRLVGRTRTAPSRSTSRSLDMTRHWS
jgi:ankyrin repeat protein